LRSVEETAESGDDGSSVIAAHLEVTRRILTFGIF